MTIQSKNRHLNICLDISPMIHRKAGLGSYVSNLARQLLAIDSNNNYSLFHYGSQTPALVPSELNSLPRKQVPCGARRWRLTVAARHLSGLNMDQSFKGVDVFHATEHLLPPFGTIRTVFTFHDAIYALFPQYHLPLNRLFLGLMMPRFLRQANAIIAVSECSKRDAMRLYSVDPARIHVIYEGVDPAFRPLDDSNELARVREKYGLPPRFILYFSTIEPRKNLKTLLDAFNTLLTRDRTIPDLVIAGRKGWLYEPVFAQVRLLGLESRVHFTDWVAPEDAPGLVNAAGLFAYPSLYEGFGLAPLEAMACGTPVICSNAASLPEVVGDAAILIDPRDVGGLAGALERVLSDSALSHELRAKGIAQAAKFSWERTARETLRVYESIDN